MDKVIAFLKGAWDRVFGKVSLETALFVFSLALASFLYGAAVMKWKIFPYNVLHEAQLALEALSLIEGEDKELLEIGVSADAPPAPVYETLSATAGDEPLLVTGGFWRMMDKCPNFGCIAFVVNRQGEVLHTWEVDPEALVAGAQGFSGQFGPDAIYPIGLALEPDGGLVVSFHARNAFPYQVGVVKLSREGAVVWKHFDNSHHWIDRDDAGAIYAPSARLVDIKETEAFAGSAIESRCWTGRYFDEGVRVYAPDGTIRKEFWIFDSFLRSGWPGFLYSLRNGCDPAHVNSAEALTAQVAAHIPGARAGDILLSVREPSVVALLDGENGAVRRLVAGRTAAQHGAQVMPDGTVVAFDNQGGDPATGGARVVRINLVNGEAQTLYPRRSDDPLLPFHSPDGGFLQVSPDGKRIIVSSKEDRRAFEIDVATGEPLWSMRNCFDASAYIARHKIRAGEHHNACFVAYGVYYVTDTAFLGRAQ